MIKLFRTGTMLLVLMFSAALHAKTLTIYVQVAQNGGKNVVAYDHKEKAHGAHGHVFVADGDSVNWVCRGNCDSVSVSFPSSPCASNSSTSCNNVSTGNLDLGLYKYTITVTFHGASATDDPDVIVDNGAISVEIQKSRPAKKKK